MQASANGILAGKLASRERFAQESSIGRRLGVALIKISAAAQSDAHGLAVLRADRIAKDVSSAIRAVAFELRAIQAHDGRIIAERQEAGECSLLDAWNVAHGFQGLFEEATS